MKQYRIGDFAKFLGVTPDLLKHYEEIGLIHSERSLSGYRYYPFNTTTLLLESIRLRNYGLTLHEIREILQEKSVDTETMERRLAGCIETLREENRLNQALIEDYEEFLAWKEPLAERDSDWSIRWSRPMCFLPHSRQDEFLDDPRIYELVKDWMSYIPIVKSSARIEPDGEFVWGLLVEKRKAEQLHLPVNSVVEEIPTHKVFYYPFRGMLRARIDEDYSVELNPAMAQLASMNLEAAGPIYRTTLMPCDWEKGIRYQYGYYAVPIQT